MDLDFWPVPARDRHLFFLIDYYYIYSAIRRSSQKKHDDIPAHPASLYLFSKSPCISFPSTLSSRLHICRLPPPLLFSHHWLGAADVLLALVNPVRGRGFQNAH